MALTAQSQMQPTSLGGKIRKVIPPYGISQVVGYR